MKLIVLTLLSSLGLLYLNSCKSQTYNQSFSNEIKVIRIDSIDNTYVIYAKKNISDEYPKIFRILTPKDVKECHNKIEIDKIYKINLISLMPLNMVATNLGWMNYNNSQIPVKQNNVSNILYSSKNIKGLCYK